MARQKRKSEALSNARADDSDTSNRPEKRSRTKPSEFTAAGQAQFDIEGNQYWEISKNRRIAISQYQGKRMVNIREFYEKDGKILPGKKGISLPIEQYAALVHVLPQIEEVLTMAGEKIPRPNYETEANDRSEMDGVEDEKETDRKTKKKKANIEATSDEGSD